MSVYRNILFQYIGEKKMRTKMIIANATYDSYPFTPDVVMPEVSRKERNEKKKDITLREFAEDMLYWILPSFIASLIVVNHYRIFGLIGFLIVMSTLALSGSILKQARKNRCLLYLFGFSSYLLVIGVGLFLAI